MINPRTGSWAALLILALLFTAGCAKETMEPELFGSIDGMVVDGETNTGLGNVSITTTPPTDAIFTNPDGSFFIEDILTGNYTIQARKPGYTNNSVAVSVRNNRTSIARIYLEEREEDEIINPEFFEASVTSWTNVAGADSNFVDISYRFENTSSSTVTREYEVTFEIVTDNINYFQQVTGSQLQPGQTRFGSFSLYIRQNTATDVRVTNVWVR